MLLTKWAIAKCPWQMGWFCF